MDVSKMNAKEFAAIEKAAKEKMAARNRAESLIGDAIARYIKDKTRARSRKAAMEKDAAVNAPRFNKLADFERREDIMECYGWGMITQAQADRLEQLWDEREELKAKSVDGVYADLVTDCLKKAKSFVYGLFEDEIDDYETTRIAWEKERAEDREKSDEMHEDYKAWKNGWGKYSEHGTGSEAEHG